MHPFSTNPSPHSLPPASAFPSFSHSVSHRTVPYLQMVDMLRGYMHMLKAHLDVAAALAIRRDRAGSIPPHLGPYLYFF